MQQGGFFEIPVLGFLRRISRPQGCCEIPRSREYQGILGILGRPASLRTMSVKLLRNLSVFVFINRDISEIFFETNPRVPTSGEQISHPQNPRGMSRRRQGWGMTVHLLHLWEEQKILATA